MELDNFMAICEFGDESGGIKTGFYCILICRSNGSKGWSIICSSVLKMSLVNVWTPPTLLISVLIQIYVKHAQFSCYNHQ